MICEIFNEQLGKNMQILKKLWTILDMSDNVNLFKIVDMLTSPNEKCWLAKLLFANKFERNL